MHSFPRLLLFAALLSCVTLTALSSGKIAFESDESGNFEIWIVNDDGTGKAQLTNRPATGQFSPKFSPDGSEIAYMSCGSIACELRVVAASGQNDRLVKQFAAPMSLYDWSRTDWIWVAIDTASGCWREEIRRIRSDGSGEETVVTELSHGAAEHPDGDKILYVRSRPCWTPDNEIRVKQIGAAGSGEIVMAMDGQAEFSPTFAHNSAQFLFRQSDAGAGHGSPNNVYLMNVSWTSATRITNATGPDDYWEPVFSPDDLMIAAMFIDGGQRDIVIIDPSTGQQQCLVGGAPDCLASAGGNQRQPDWAASYFECIGFQSPLDAGPVTVRKNRALPLKAEMIDSGGLALSDLDITALPVLQVLFDPAGGGDVIDITDEAFPAGEGTDGNQFVFSEGLWRFNLKTKNYTAPGTYTITMISGDEAEYFVEGCSAKFVIDP